MASGGEERAAPWDRGLSGSDPREAWAGIIVLRMRAAHINKTIKEYVLRTLLFLSPIDNYVR